MTSRVTSLLLVSACLAQPVLAARTASVIVDKKGSIRIPVATLRQIGVKPDRAGSIWIRFPIPEAETPHPRPPRSLRSLPVPLPLRVLVSVDKGQVAFARTRIGVKSHVPGPPGTRYTASGSGNELILRIP